MYVIDIAWTTPDLERYIQAKGWKKEKKVRLANPEGLEEPRPDSIAYNSTIGELLDPTEIVMDASMGTLQVIGDWFLRQCMTMKALDLTPLVNVRQVGGNFLNDCVVLKALLLTPLANVQQVGDYFLLGCSSLEELDLTPLINVQQLGDNFLSNCSSLKELDLTPLVNVQKVGDNFLSRCSSLKELDLKPLANVQQVGYGFLKECSSLKALDLQPLVNVQQVVEDYGQSYLLQYCSSLEDVSISQRQVAVFGAKLENSGITPRVYGEK